MDKQMKQKSPPRFNDFDPEKLYFVPLGGCGVFGANLTLYAYKGKWLMVDFGMGFADDTMPGVDILLPDPAFIEDRKQDLLGMVITHAHEDHIGGIEHFWHRLKCPIYATPLTAALIRTKFADSPYANSVKINIIPPAGSIDLDPFKLQLIDVAHSIPEAQAVAITAGGLGTWLHTGDWKFDPNPIEGKDTDRAALKALGDAGVQGMICDSTNAMVPGHSGSEATVLKNLTDLFSEFKRRIFVTCFASNVARLHTVTKAAMANGRRVALVGRSLRRMEEAARSSGYLKGIPPFMSDEEADGLDPSQVVYIVTGSQGEPRAQLSRIASDDHPIVYFEEGDIVVFSSRTIPGNERAIEKVKNNIYMLGADVITDRDAPVHVSGHPYREELKEMYALVRPKCAIPVHGENMQLEKHADLAHECGVQDIIVPANGDVIKLGPGIPEKVGEVKSGMLALEGKRLVKVDHEAILTRRRIMFNGSVIVTVVMNGMGDVVAAPKITALGLLDDESEHDAEILAGAVDAVNAAITKIPHVTRDDSAMVEEAIRVAARRYFSAQFDRKPQTRVHLVRI